MTELSTDLHATALQADLERQPFTGLLGGAGTGKTFFAKAWAEEQAGLALCATTGIAAVNVDGVTINSFLRYFDTEGLQKGYDSGWLQARLRRKHRAGLTRILLDELSMLDGRQLTLLTKAIDEVNTGRDFEGNNEEDEGLPPLGLTVVGDFCQLPPVKAPFAFSSSSWKEYATTTLTTIRRQADPLFIGALNAARQGKGRQATEVLAPCFDPHTDPDFEGTTLLARNELVDDYNNRRLGLLTTPWDTFKSLRWGQQRKEWKLIPQELKLRAGALVMLLANRWDPDLGGYRYVNGDLGIYDGLVDGMAAVTIQRTGQQETVRMVTREIEAKEEKGEEDLPDPIAEAPLPGPTMMTVIADGHAEKLLGAVTYLPIRVAYASTVHKSQGLSLSKVQVNLRDDFIGHPGMVYVALSRCRTLGGLRLVGTPQLFHQRCSIDPRVRRWI